MKNKYFIAVYTNEVKDYCDAAFFHNLYALSSGEPVTIIDNTTGSVYFDKLQKSFLVKGYNNFSLHHLEVAVHPQESRFQRNVCDSVSMLRNIFLSQTDCAYFLILESDVYPPVDLLNRFDSAIEKLHSQDKGWGITGGLYYEGFHNYGFDSTLTTLEKTSHCLSGCTVYKRELVEKYPFRYDPGNLAPFPDAFICYDAGKEYSLWNEHTIKCEHLHNPLNGLRIK